MNDDRRRDGLRRLVLHLTEIDELVRSKMQAFTRRAGKRRGYPAAVAPGGTLPDLAVVL
jgi:hypothetical protein